MFSKAGAENKTLATADCGDTMPVSFRYHGKTGLAMAWRVAALYHFADLADPSARQGPLLELCHQHGVKGTLLLAHEGVNGTICGAEDGIARVVGHIEAWPEIGSLDVKYSTSSEQGFLRMKVKLKKEIVTMGKPGIDAARDAGVHVDPRDWNALIDRPGVMVIDTRNCYETRIGTFEGAVDPMTENFREFPDWADALAARDDRPEAVAMYCTGGIRCEKASAYMKSLGFKEVYHLRGGILKYLEEMPEEESLWRGDCFVFDERVSLRHGLAEGEYTLCRACKEPLSPDDRDHPSYRPGVSCHRCTGRLTEKQRDRFEERQRQVKMARDRGEAHIGDDAGRKSLHGSGKATS